jgi:hypothetical protein
MFRTICVATFLMLGLVETEAYAQSILDCGRPGNCVGSIDGQSFRSYTNEHGQTSGSIGREPFWYQTDKRGNSSGSIGREPFLVPACDDTISMTIDKYGL